MVVWLFVVVETHEPPLKIHEKYIIIFLLEKEEEEISCFIYFYDTIRIQGINAVSICVSSLVHEAFMFFACCSLITFYIFTFTLEKKQKNK